MPTRKTKKDDTALPEKGKSLETAISQIETQFGPGTIMRMGEREVQSIPKYFYRFIRIGFGTWHNGLA